MAHISPVDPDVLYTLFQERDPPYDALAAFRQNPTQRINPQRTNSNTKPPSRAPNIRDIYGQLQMCPAVEAFMLKVDGNRCLRASV